MHHDGGHTLGSATMQRGPSPMSAYFMGRSRMRFVARYRPYAVPVAFVYGVAKVAKHMLKRQTGAGLALLRGICGFPPSRAVREKLRPQMVSER